MNEPPPLNRAQAWYRVLLWLAPTGFVFAIPKAGMFSIVSMRFVPFGARFWPLCALAAIIAFCGYCGWLDGHLSSKARRLEGEERKKAVRNHAIFFSLWQVIVTPLLIGVLVFGACLFTAGDRLR